MIARYASDQKLKGFLGGATPRTLGKYRLIREIGRGGGGSVHEAEDRDLHRRVALKIAQIDGNDPSAVARFHREAAIAAQLQHPNIVGVHEVGLVQGEDGGAIHFIAMDLVEGESFATALQDSGTPRADLLRILEDAARAAAYAHGRGVVHRDLKPANILIEKGGRVLLTDFGLAHGSGFDVRLTVSGQVMGTPAYMAPEQVEGRSRAAGARTDVYALGVMLYEVLARRLPFEGRSAAEVYRKIRDEEPPSLKGVPKDLEVLCRRALEKRPEHRFRDATEFADELARVRKGEPIRSRPISATVRAWRWCLRRKWIAVPVASTFLLALAFAGWLGRSAVRAAELRKAGRTAEQEGRLQNARDAYIALLEFRPDDGESLQAIRRIDARTAESVRAERESHQLLQFAREEIEELTMLTVVSRKEKRSEEFEATLARARDLIGRAIALAPHSAAARYLNGRMLLFEKKPQEAEAEFTESLRLDPRQPVVYWHRGQARMERRNLDGALADFAVLLEADPSHLRGRLRRARLLIGVEDYAAALRDYEYVLRQSPNLSEAYPNRGYLRFKTGDFAGAVADLKRATEDLPEVAEFWIVLGEAQLEVGDKKSALADLEKAQSLLPASSREKLVRYGAHWMPVRQQLGDLFRRARN